jgi:hypothetical protein
MSMPLAQLVGVQRATTGAHCCADSCTLFSAGKAANAGSRGGRSRYRQFVTMLLPKCAAVTTMTTSLTGRQRCRRESQYHHY